MTWLVVCTVAAAGCLVMAVSHDWPAGGWWFAGSVACLWLSERRPV